MDELTPRQKEILACLIESHIATTLPVGSLTLTERYGLSLSPASVRNEMGLLEERGYLSHPHTSAGRVPTDKGYHFYVREIVREEPVSSELFEWIDREMERKINNLENLTERVSSILSAMVKETALVMAPLPEELYLKELSLVILDARRLLAVWCSTTGLVQDCLVEVDEPLSSEEVERARNFINQELRGVALASLEQELLWKIQSRRDSLRRLYESTLEIVRESMSHWNSPRLHIEGSHYILNEPEFQDLGKLQLLMEALEDKSLLIDLLKGHPSSRGIRVAIGEKELSREIWDCALVSVPYGAGGKPMGILGVLGPRRMPYGRIMGRVHQVSAKVNEILTRMGS